MNNALFLAVPFALIVAGCSAQDNDPGPGGVSVGEAKALDEAAEMIETRRPAPGVIPEPAVPISAVMPQAGEKPPTD